MVTPVEPAAKLEQKGYNRGLILGLTMAESMLLLVFCLLLVAGAIIKSERGKTQQAIREREVAQLETASLRKKQADTEKLVAQLETRILQLERQLKLTGMTEEQQEALRKEWRELVEAREALKEYQSLGMSVAQISRLSEISKTLNNAGLQTDDLAVLEKGIRQLIEVAKNDADNKPHEWPPIINLSEAGGYYFRSGSAELTQAFDQKLRTSIASEIAENLERYKVDIIEVIGHTDEQPISRSASNLDQAIIDVVDGKKPVTVISPADNAGLGMARAIAVVNALRSDDKLKAATILPMSAAQLVLPGDQLTSGQAGNVEARRRIEIRIRRRSEN